MYNSFRCGGVYPAIGADGVPLECTSEGSTSEKYFTGLPSHYFFPAAFSLLHCLMAAVAALALFLAFFLSLSLSLSLSLFLSLSLSLSLSPLSFSLSVCSTTQLNLSLRP